MLKNYPFRLESSFEDLSFWTENSDSNSGEFFETPECSRVGDGILLFRKMGENSGKWVKIPEVERLVTRGS